MASLVRKSLASSSDSSHFKVADDESVPDSWVELAAPPSRGSLSSSIDALLLEAQQEPTSTKGSGHSPKSLQSPNVEFAPNLDAVKCKLANDLVPPGNNTDWIWDWSSRPEVVPPKQYRIRQQSGAVDSTLTTPPNSRVPSPECLAPAGTRHSKLIRHYLFRVDVLVGLFMSNLVHFLLGAALGWCLCKRIHDKPGKLD